MTWAAAARAIDESMPSGTACDRSVRAERAAANRAPVQDTIRAGDHPHHRPMHSLVVASIKQMRTDAVAHHGALAAFATVAIDAALPARGALTMLVAGAAAASERAQATSWLTPSSRRSPPALRIARPGAAGARGRLSGPRAAPMGSGAAVRARGNHRAARARSRGESEVPVCAGMTRPSWSRWAERGALPTAPCPYPARSTPSVSSALPPVEPSQIVIDSLSGTR